MNPLFRKYGFTLIELMIVVAVIAILISIGVASYRNMVQKSRDGTTIANLATLRSSLNIYYTDNNEYPRDDLSTILTDSQYMQNPPLMRAATHVDNYAVIAEVGPTDSGQWSYDNSSGSPLWGHIAVGCLHGDHRGVVWSSY